ncbi:MAG: CBS domain-containing protein [Halovenus sp.]
MNADLTVRDIMDREYVGVSESDGIAETVELLLREDATAAVVLRGQEPVGVLTERDVYAVLAESSNPSEATVGDAPLTTVPTVAPDVSLDVAADKMATRSVSRLRVVDNGETLGLVTEHDILAARAPQAVESTKRQAEADADAAATTGAVDAGTREAFGSENRQDEFGEQSICEGCGTLTRDLSSFNGQLLCPDCRDI